MFTNDIVKSPQMSTAARLGVEFIALKVCNQILGHHQVLKLVSRPGFGACAPAITHQRPCLYLYHQALLTIVDF